MGGYIIHPCGCQEYEDERGTNRCYNHQGYSFFKIKTTNIGGAMEDKSDKPQISRLPKDALYEICKVFQSVTDKLDPPKYKRDDWRTGVSWKNNYDSLQRHLMDFIEGKNMDEETNLHILAHAGCRILMQLEMALKGTGTDDRFKR